METTEESIEEPPSLIDLEQVRKFIQYENARFKDDREAIISARQMSNGDSWRKEFGDVRTTLTHKVRVDAVNQIVNKICSKFTSNPFRFIAVSQGEQKQLELDYGSYDSAIALAFRDSVVTGQGFIYVDYATGKARRLDAGSVMMDSSGSSPYVIWIDKERKESGESRRAAKDDLGIGDNVIEHDEETERLVFTIYRKTENGIAAAESVNGEIRKEDILPISEYPIIRIPAEESWSSDRLTFRGLYHKASGISDLIDITFSRVASNILTAPRQKYWVSSFLAESEGFRKTMSELHTQDIAYVPYIAYDDQNRPIPPPIRDDGRLFVDELVAVTDKMIGYINMLFGFEASENADAGNKTAQEILFRRENQNANYSQYLFNLSVAMGNACRIYESLGFEKVFISQGPYENIYRQTSQQSVLAINDYCTAQPQRAVIAPLLIKFSGLDEATKAELNAVIQQETKLGELVANSQQSQSQLQQLQAQNQQLQQMAGALRNQQLNNDKALQIDVQEERMRLADKERERIFKASEAEKDRAVELLKAELDHPEAQIPIQAPINAIQEATDLNPIT
jgi:hypothetical protein